jgi:hypothetical protein
VLSSFFLDGMEKLLSLTGQPECPDIPMFTLPSSSIKFGHERATNLQKKIYFDLFNYYSKNEPGETFFSNMVLLSHVNPSGATYEGVTPI